MHDGGVIPCSSVLNMLPQIAERLLLLSRVLPMQAPHDEQAASVLAGTWQAPGLFCSLWTRVHAPHVPPPQRYLLLRAWPLVTHKDPLPSEPDVAPQVAIRIGLGELEEAARYLAELDGLIESKAWEGCKRPRSMIRTVVPGELEGRRRYKREVIRWRFAPEFDDPILEAIQRVRRMGDAERVQKLTAFFESRQPRREAYLATREANWWRTIYIHSDKYKTPLVTLLLTVILRQEGVIPHTEEESLDTHAVQYLKSLRWAEDGRAYLAMLRNMGGNETWKGLRRYIKTAARGLALNALKEDISPNKVPRFIDEEQSIYNPYWVAREYAVHVKTVQRWMKKNGDTITDGGKRGFSEVQLIAFRQQDESKQARKRLRKEGKDRGMSDASINRALKADRIAGKTWGDIEEAIERNAARQLRRKGVTSSAFEETISTKDQIAECEARLTKATPGTPCRSFGSSRRALTHIMDPQRQQDLWAIAVENCHATVRRAR